MWRYRHVICRAVGKSRVSPKLHGLRKEVAAAPAMAAGGGCASAGPGAPRPARGAARPGKRRSADPDGRRGGDMMADARGTIQAPSQSKGRKAAG